ncbi:MAG: hypothetical protein J6J44_07130 [Lachnospiraceae bacterium]|nr:hypothetical protein [Lachnospiraceae bacterium]
MTGKEYLQRVRKHIYYVFDRDSIEQELAEHLQDSMDVLREEGYSKEEAENLAVDRMGSPDEVGKQLNKEHHPVLGYAWLASVLILIVLAVPLVLSVGNMVYMGIKTITPITIENSEKNYSLDMELELSTHKVRLDNICVNEKGDYYLTYRAWTKYSYSRAGWSSELFYLQDSNGKYLGKSGFSSGGRYGYKEFAWPEDGLLYLRTRDDQLIEINLNEVMGNEAG